MRQHKSPIAASLQKGMLGACSDRIVIIVGLL